MEQHLGQAGMHEKSDTYDLEKPDKIKAINALFYAPRLSNSIKTGWVQTAWVQTAWVQTRVGTYLARLGWAGSSAHWPVIGLKEPM